MTDMVAYMQGDMMAGYNCNTIQLLKKHTLNPEITILYQCHDQKATFPKNNPIWYIYPSLIAQSSREADSFDHNTNCG